MLENKLYRPLTNSSSSEERREAMSMGLRAQRWSVSSSKSRSVRGKTKSEEAMRERASFSLSSVFFFGLILAVFKVRDLIQQSGDFQKIRDSSEKVLEERERICFKYMGRDQMAWAHYILFF